MDNNENFENQQKSTPEENATPQNVNIPQVTADVKVPIYKKWWFWLVIGVVVLAIIIGSSGSDSDDQGDSLSNDGTVTNNSTTSNNLGDYSVVIDSCRLAKDYEGNPIVIVKYKFTNNSNDPAAFWLSIQDNVYQNGVGLNECYLPSDSANYSSDNQMKEIKKGVTLEIEVAYELNDSTTPIDVEVEEYISFSDKKITRRFSFTN